MEVSLTGLSNAEKVNLAQWPQRSHLSPKRARANGADTLWAFTIDRRIVVSYRGMYCNPGRLQGWRWWKDSLCTELTLLTSRVAT
jgi:hypothetical protein